VALRGLWRGGGTTGMTPDTVHRIAQEIQKEKAKLTVEETWLQKQERSDTRDESFRRINFWRDIFKAAELKLSSLA
jgi:hypothetical protein